MKKQLIPFVAALLIAVLSSGLADVGQGSGSGDQSFISTNARTHDDQSTQRVQPQISTLDAVNGNWAPLANYPAGAAGGIANYWWPDSGKAFLAGGSPAATIPNCYFYNPVTNTYTSKASLPTGRAYGKMVRVRQSLYLVGSIGASFTVPDGALYEYNPVTDIWTPKASIPAPVIQEMAVCVWNDSLIITVGGSTTGFTGGVNSVRVYNPTTDTWTILAGAFPVAAMGLAAECIGNEIVVIGGVNSTPAVANIAYRGTVVPGSPISIAWRTTPNPYGEGVYRAATALWSGHMLFGPTQKGASPPSGKLNGIKIADSTITNFLPDMPAPTLGNIPNMSVRITADSVYLYMFGGFNGTAVVANCSRYAFANPTPPSGTSTTTRRPSLFIPDNIPAGVFDTLTVSGVPAGTVVRRVTVSIDTLTHTYVGDFRMTLSHGGTTRTLMNRPGIGVNGSSGNDFIGTVLVDSAARRIDSIAATGTPPNGPPYTGFFRPDSGGAPTIVSSSLAPFNGSNPNGQWILFISDNAAQDTGRVRQWRLILEYGAPTAVEPIQTVPDGFTLSQNYPNPFNPTTTIQFGVPVAANITLKVYNVLGQEVITLVDGQQSAGSFQTVWNGRNSFGNQVASGMYFYSLVAKSADSKTTFTNIKKMLLVK